MNGLEFSTHFLDGLDNPWSLLLLKVTAVLAAGWLGHAALAKAAPRYRLFWWRGTVCALALLCAATLLLPRLSILVAEIPPREHVADAAGFRASRSGTEAGSFGHDTVPAAAGRTQPPGAPRRVVLIDPPGRVAEAASVRAGRSGTEAGGFGHAAVAPGQPPRASERKVASSATAQNPGFLENPGFWDWISPWQALAGVWLAGVALAVLNLLRGAVRVRRFLRQATPAGAELTETCREIAARIGCRSNVRVLRHAGISSPVLYGVLRPAIVLPGWMCGENCRADWRGVFAHELSHVRSRDLAWQLLIHAAATLLWFHPLAWRLRRAHVLACELKADHDSVASLESSADYLRTLARVALATNGLLPVVGLAMARSSEISRRVSFLKGPLPAGKVRRSLLVAVGLTGLASVGLLGSLRIARAEAVVAEAASFRARRSATEAGSSGHDAKPAEKPKPAVSKNVAQRTVVVTIVDDAGRPVPNAKLYFRVGKDRKDLVADKTGTVKVEVPRDLKSSVFLRGSAPGRASMAASWQGNRRRQQPPPKVPDRVELRLGKGTTIGGIVVDAKGKPVAGATIWVSGSGPRNAGDPRYASLTAFQATTNAKGEWRCPIAPAKLDSAYVTLKHSDFVPEGNPRYLQGAELAALRKLAFQSVLQRGIAVEGFVRDPDGKPIEGAAVVFGNSPFDADRNADKPKTDNRGHYRFNAVRKGSTVVTVLAKGFAPQLRRLAVTDDMDAVNFQLKKGKTIRFRVVDKDGKPLEGASIVPDRWLGHRTLLSLRQLIPEKTDRDGRLAWTFAPAEEVHYDAFKRGYMSARNNAITADGKEHVIVLPDVLQIAGRVVDAETKKPVPTFRVVTGIVWDRLNRTYWNLREPTAGRDGTFVIDQSEPRAASVIRVEADGYRPAISRKVLDKEGKVSLRFELQRAKPIAGSVVTRAGKPVAGAKVYVCTPSNGAYVRNGASIRHQDTAMLTTQKDGTFKLGVQTEHYALLVVADAGYARIPQAEFETDTKIELVDWARVKGTAYIGAKPAVNATIKLQFNQDNPSGQPHIYFDYGATVDRNGKFTFEKIPPGMSGFAYRQIVLRRFGDMTTTGWTHGQPLEFTPGKTLKVRIGGTGRPIVGRLAPPKGAKTPVRWNVGFHSLKLDRPRLPVPPGGRPEFIPAYSVYVKPDGSFRLEDIPPGKYVLKFDLREPVVRRGFEEAGPRIGSYEQSVTIAPIPGGRTEKPLDLGKLTLEAP
jgi:beta-lactamase regulating signal transducer with metallopeptidase domain/uncharacterized GH25 family protein